MFSYLLKVYYLLRDSRKSLVFLLAVFIFSSCLEFIGIGLIGTFLNVIAKPDEILTLPYAGVVLTTLGIQSSRNASLFFGFIIISIFLIKSVLYFFSKFFIFRYSYDQKRFISVKLLKSYLAQPYGLFLGVNTANLIKNIVIEVDHFVIFCMLPLLEMTANLIVIVLLFILLASTSLPLLLFILISILPVVFLSQILGKKNKDWGKLASVSQQEKIKVANHALGSLTETRLIGCEEFFENQLDIHSKNFSKAQTYFQAFQVLPRILIENSVVIGLILFILFKSFVGSADTDLTSTLGVFTVASIRVIPSVSILFQSLMKLRKGTFALNCIYHDNEEGRKNETQTQILVRDNLKQNLQQERSRELIILKEVDYSYPGTNKKVLSSISIEIAKGDSIGLVGKSGSGKTTLVNLILGLLTPTGGDILVNNASIYQNLREWWSLVGYIPQNIFLIDETIERNVAFGVPDHEIDHQKVLNAIQLANLQDVVEQLPYGLNQLVGERGSRLSGGQRQRIGIARALYHEKEILVLDEVTSALDSVTEKLISQTIDSLKRKKTLIMITHRLDTVKNFDRIHLLDEGRLIHSGDYLEVNSFMKKNLVVS